MSTTAIETLKKVCTRNLTLKLLSLAVAFCIWSFTAISRESRYELTLPIEMRYVPPGYTLGSPLPGEIHVTLSGPSLLVDGARRSNSRVILNLRGAVPGKTLFTHLDSYLKLPDGIRVIRISPASLEIELIRKQAPLPQGDQQQ